MRKRFLSFVAHHALLFKVLFYLMVLLSGVRFVFFPSFKIQNPVLGAIFMAFVILVSGIYCLIRIAASKDRKGNGQ